jgi:hypothetical protein
MITVQVPTWAKMRNPIEKITKNKSDLGVAQVGECLPSKCEALSPNASTSKREKKSISPFKKD